MKIRLSRLRTIIREEVSRVLTEGDSEADTLAAARSHAEKLRAALTVAEDAIRAVRSNFHSDAAALSAVENDAGVKEKLAAAQALLDAALRPTHKVADSWGYKRDVHTWSTAVPKDLRDLATKLGLNVYAGDAERRPARGQTDA